ncbi:MAG: ATP-binding protein [Deltaproteobacteria bacterium]|jgi:hypothetical protein|nr:ATP-binding protein [Deltaproteobacteria bacterium]
MANHKPKRFNVDNHYDPAVYYAVPARERLPQIYRLIEENKFFVVYAPKDYGKTCLAREAVEELRRDGQIYAWRYSLGGGWRGDQDRTMTNLALRLHRFLLRQILAKTIASRGFNLGALTPERERVLLTVLGAPREVVDPPPFEPKTAFLTALRLTCRLMDKKRVIFFDDVEALPEPALTSFLSQLREGYLARDQFPFLDSMALIGQRNLMADRDRLFPNRGPGEDPLDFLAESLPLPGFTVDEIAALYGQSEAEKGQIFDPSAHREAYNWSEGHPWLVNALARVVLDRQPNPNGEPLKVTKLSVQDAGMHLANRRNRNVYQALKAMREPPFKRVLRAIIGGLNLEEATEPDDARLALESGLVKWEKTNRLRLANRVYRQAIVRKLTQDFQRSLEPGATDDFIKPGPPDPSAILLSFQSYMRQKGDQARHLVNFCEFDPFLILIGYLTRYLPRCGIRLNFLSSSQRAGIDILYGPLVYHIVMKLNVNPRHLDIAARYLAKLVKLKSGREGWLVAFDPDRSKPFSQKTGWETVLKDGVNVHVVYC